MDNINSQILLEEMLDKLCKYTNRDIFVMLPEKEEERVAYLKMEILKTLNKVN